MKLNADIIYNDLQKVLDVSFSGDKLKELVLQRPEFYIDNSAVFQSNHVYVCSADHLSENPSVEDNVLPAVLFQFGQKKTFFMCLILFRLSLTNTRPGKRPLMG